MTSRTKKTKKQLERILQEKSTTSESGSVAKPGTAVPHSNTSVARHTVSLLKTLLGKGKEKEKEKG